MPGKPPVLTKPIPSQIVNEGATFGPLNLSDFIQPPDPESGPVQFVAELSDGRALPKGLICIASGTLSGIPAAGTLGSYEIIVTASLPAGDSLSARFNLTIKERITIGQSHHYFTDLKAKVWEALGQNLPLPELSEMLDRPLTLVELYYLMQRFATLTIWDVYNLDTPSDKIALNLEGASSHYHIYDRGSCIVGVPKDLFSHERTLEDALQTARVMAREVYKRGWTVELAGFNKMVRASWIEIQLLVNKHGKPLEVLHYEPTEADYKLYQAHEKAHLGGFGRGV
jgi:hypothetical protein